MSIYKINAQLLTIGRGIFLKNELWFSGYRIAEEI